MKQTILTILALCIFAFSIAQSPVVTSWLQNTSETGTYYVSGNPNALENNILVNCQQVEYSDEYVYVTCSGVPSYTTGPFQDGNPGNAENQNSIYRIPIYPEEGSGTDETTPGTIGVFINGVSLYDYRDGVAWNPITNALCGGPGNPPCPGGMGAENDWNRDAIPAEMAGFDCAKGHPAMGDYHHHQNPSAFDLDQVVISDVCNAYDADGLYVINDSEHSPLVGFAFDGFPIYGAYGYLNSDGSGGITRIKSGYELRDISERTEHADGTAVDNGPDVSDTYYLGYFREDYVWVEHPGEEDYLDSHNGRWCVTPEYPDGTYAYFCTVDENWNSAYPYAVGPTFYGVHDNLSVNNVNETTTIYTGADNISELNQLKFKVFPNPASDIVTLQASTLVKENLQVELIDVTGRIVSSYQLNAGSTLAYFDTQTLYAGNYIIRITAGDFVKIEELIISK